MTLDEFRSALSAYWHECNDRALQVKDTEYALSQLHKMYEGLDAHERALANTVIAEWLVSDLEAMRFDALVLVKDYKIREAVGALETLAERLENDASPGSPFERNRVLSALEQMLN